MALLPDHSRRESPSWWWFDLASHGVSTWEYIEVAVGMFDWADQMRSLETARAVPKAIERWRHDDPLHGLWAELAEMRRAENQG